MANGQSPPSNVATPLQYAQDYASVQEMTASYGAPNAVSPALYGELVAKGLTSADIKNNLSAVFSGSAQTNQEAQAMLVSVVWRAQHAGCHRHSDDRPEWCPGQGQRRCRRDA